MPPPDSSNPANVSLFPSGAGRLALTSLTPIQSEGVLPTVLKRAILQVEKKNVESLESVLKLFDAYEAAGGGRVDPDEALWWEVLGTLKWGIMCIIQCNVHMSGFSRSHELAAIGRRVCENEHDLFLALEGRW